MWENQNLEFHIPVLNCHSKLQRIVITKIDEIYFISFVETIQFDHVKKVLILMRLPYQQDLKQSYMLLKSSSVIQKS